jgi:Flp pilus assembly protein CpaB
MPALPPRLRRGLRSVRRAVLLRRRPLAALCFGLGIWLALRVVAGPPAPTTEVLVAARDLPAGLVLTDSDLVERPFADGSEPSGLLGRPQATGRTLAAPLTAGEPVTDVRVVAAGLLEGYPGLVAVPVRIPDAATVALLRVGDRIDLLATDPRGSGTDLVAHGVPVLALPDPPADAVPIAPNSPGSGGLVVVGTTPALSEMVADAAVRRFLTVVWSS